MKPWWWMAVLAALLGGLFVAVLRSSTRKWFGSESRDGQAGAG